MKKSLQPTKFERNQLSVLTITVDAAGVDLRNFKVMDVIYEALDKTAFPWASMCYNPISASHATLVVSVAAELLVPAAKKHPQGVPTGSLTVTLQDSSNPPNTIPVPAAVQVAN